MKTKRNKIISILFFKIINCKYLFYIGNSKATQSIKILKLNFYTMNSGFEEKLLTIDDESV